MVNHMMNALYAPMEEMEAFQQIRRRMQKKQNTGMILAGGCIDSQKAHLIGCLSRDYPVTCIIAPDDLRAKEICENYRIFDQNVLLYPARDFLFFQADLQSRTLTAQRVRCMKALADITAGHGLERVTIVLTLRAMMSHCMRAEDWMDAIRSYSVEDEIDPQEEKKTLSLMGYERVDMVEVPGQFASRGGILDIYPLTEENPVRIELWGDEIDSIRYFDVESQRTKEQIQGIRIYPAAEFVTTPEITRSGLKRISAQAQTLEKKFRGMQKSEEAFRAARIAKDARERLEDFGDTSVMEGLCDYFYPDAVSLMEYFPEGTVFFVDEPARASQGTQEAEEEFRQSLSHRLEKGYVLPGQAKMLFTGKQIEEKLSERGMVGLTAHSGAKCPFPVTARVEIQAAGCGVYNSNFELLVKDLSRYKRQKYRVVLLCASRTRGQRLARDLTDNGVIAFYSEKEERILQGGEVMVTYGNTHRGYEYPMLKFAVLSESDIFGRERRKKRRKSERSGKTIASFTQLHPGDFVVHENHGIGIYRGIEKIQSDGVLKDYMKIEYAGNSNLYVLATQLDMIQKYAGADSKTPKISKLGGETWARTKAKVRTAVEEVAQDLVDLYAVRSNRKGYAYGPDTSFQTEFEELFPFEETQDQIQAIEDTKKDMESTKIMDRLICGDVGYGKTEIAIRAAFKAVCESRQTAFLVPTTILAQQHYNTFLQRMKDYPVRIGMLSRFNTKAESAEILKGLATGQVDIVIGTHRLLSKDVKFKDLGLLVIDEEQRFGVAHKEKIKQMRSDVDVLTLTATPIPRTLHMSLAGIRDMSVLEEAPQDRLPIQTFVMEFNEETIREAIIREMARGGQVYLVYNHVSTIADMAGRVAGLVPEARIAFTHGRMASNQIEDIMYDFINGDVDVLVTTTIIETGLDIANVNTMIICDADRLGLSQLYQLRGRVGRSSRTAYAFLMYRPDRILADAAEKRLGAIREYTELGSGFRIAMRDLEIRGAGNLLGKAQSGHMAQVGYDLYCKLLNQSVMRLKGETTQQDEFETVIDLSIDAFLPDSYIPNENQKLDLYKRIASITGEDDYEDMLDELMDRYGEPPSNVQNLLKAALIRSMAHGTFLTELTQKGAELRFTFWAKAPVNVDRIGPFMGKYKRRLRFVAGENPHFTYALPTVGGIVPDVLAQTEKLLRDMKEELF